MNNKFKEINWNPGTDERKSFGKLLIIGFPFVALFWTTVLGFKGGNGFVWNWELFGWIVGGGSGTGMFCMLIPSLALPVYRLWFFLICIIDTVITLVLLPTFYYVILFPYSWILRMIGKNPIEKKPRECKTYWKDVAGTKDTSQYYRQF